nr:PREDICTED: activating transcription factor 7-interacting protein 1-like isoform X1 [Bemisia tabaci]XP_018913104.1 PREDICTED: activating transcription factor 7-interacting protein 1-like isoform X1 [Bemisia tabaci]XP_018913105.1 PREDICTED: activating transcription factor 7-interacting protein 1-like isoform X1 [Bemisia tabaci]
MTLIDGCLLVGANDNRLVKRTIPIMNGEEANVLSAFTYPLPLTNAVPDNGIEKDPTDSSDNVDTEKSNDLKINLSNEVSGSSSDEADADAIPLPKPTKHSEALQSEDKELAKVCKIVNNICNNVIQLAESINSQSESSHAGPVHSVESATSTCVNACFKRTSEISSVSTVTLNGTVVSPTELNSKPDSDSSLRINQRLVQNLENNGTEGTEIDISASVLSKEPEIIDKTNKKESSYLTESSEMLENTSFESASEEMILQIDEEELFETDNQPKLSNECINEVENADELRTVTTSQAGSREDSSSSACALSSPIDEKLCAVSKTDGSVDIQQTVVSDLKPVDKGNAEDQSVGIDSLHTEQKSTNACSKERSESLNNEMKVSEAGEASLSSSGASSAPVLSGTERDFTEVLPEPISKEKNSIDYEVQSRICETETSGKLVCEEKSSNIPDNMFEERFSKLSDSKSMHTDKVVCEKEIVALSNTVKPVSDIASCATAEADRHASGEGNCLKQAVVNISDIHLPKSNKYKISPPVSEKSAREKEQEEDSSGLEGINVSNLAFHDKEPIKSPEDVSHSHNKNSNQECEKTSSEQIDFENTCQVSDAISSVHREIVKDCTEDCPTELVSNSICNPTNGSPQEIDCIQNHEEKDSLKMLGKESKIVADVDPNAVNKSIRNEGVSRESQIVSQSMKNNKKEDDLSEDGCVAVTGSKIIAEAESKCSTFRNEIAQSQDIIVNVSDKDSNEINARERNVSNNFEEEDGSKLSQIDEITPSLSDSKDAETKEPQKTKKSTDIEDPALKSAKTAEEEKETEGSYGDLCTEELILDDECSLEMGGREEYQLSESSSPPDSSVSSQSDEDEENDTHDDHTYNDDSCQPQVSEEDTVMSNVSDDAVFEGEPVKPVLKPADEPIIEKYPGEVNDPEDEGTSDAENEVEANDGDNVENNKMKAREKTDEKEAVSKVSEVVSKEVSEEPLSAETFFERMKSVEKIEDEESKDAEYISQNVLDQMISFVSTNHPRNEPELANAELECSLEKAPNSPLDKLSLSDHIYSASAKPAGTLESSSLKRLASVELEEDESQIKRAKSERILSTGKRKLSKPNESDSFSVSASSYKKSRILDCANSNHSSTEVSAEHDLDEACSSMKTSAVTEGTSVSSDSNNSTTKEDIEIGRFNRFQSNLRNFSRQDLEELIVLKMLEVMKYKGVAGDQQKMLTCLQEQCDAQKKLLAGVQKQYNENCIIMRKFIEQSQSQLNKNLVIPMKATRSVGLQVALADSPAVMKSTAVLSGGKVGSPQRPLAVTIPQARSSVFVQKAQPMTQSVPTSIQSATAMKTKFVKTVVSPQSTSSPTRAPGPTLKVLTPVAKSNSVASTAGGPTRLIQSSNSQILNAATPQKSVKLVGKTPNTEVIDLVEDSQQQARAFGIQNFNNKGVAVPQSSPGQVQQQISYVVTSGTQVPLYISPTSNQATRMITSSVGSRGVLNTPLKNGQIIQLQNKSGVIAGNQFIVANSSQFKQVIRPVMNLNSPPKLQQLKHVPRILETRLTRHPAPLPVGVTQASDKSWKMRPPKPTLRIGKNGSGITLSWTLNGYDKEKYAEIVSYQLFAYQEGSEPPNTDLWKKVGDVKALPLPMACTLTKFVVGHRYHFAVRAVDEHSRVGEYSTPDNIMLN